MYLNKLQRSFTLNTPNWLKELSGAWIFYTILPKWPLIIPKFDRIARFAPVIGLVIGLSEALVLKVLYYLNWSSESLAFIAIALGLWLTGGLHYDGLMDTADGISAGAKKQLKAMKDSRIGASGIVALTINLAFQIAALIKLNSFYLFALPISCFWGRYAQILAIGNYPYIQEKGSSKFHKSNWEGNLVESLPSIICILCILILILNLNTLNLLKFYLIFFSIVGFIPALIIPKIIFIRLKGHSGDTYGASVVLVETFMLTIMSSILPKIL